MNDAIRGLAAAGGSDEIWEFFCECDDLGCHSLVELTLLEFDERRSANPAEPIVAGDHRG